MTNTFSTRLSKGTFDAILTAFFQRAGYIDHNMSLEFTVLETEDEETVFIEGVIKEQSVQ